jgi:DNA-binding LacI/PurR family transcriptional regulator
VIESGRTPSIYDVARRAGVSHQTVSRVLNGYAGIRPTTRDRVLVAVDELGYRPNRAARALATSRSHSLGVLVPATADFGPTSSLHAVEQAARDEGFHALVTSTRLDEESVRASLEFLVAQSIEALVVIAPYRVVTDGLARVPADIPTVALQTGATGTGELVGVDQVAGGRLAARHLLELGHRRIQQLTGPADFLEAAVRRDAVEATLAEAGLAPLPRLAGDWTADSGYAAGALVDPTATAIVCGNDQMALGLIHALADLGRRVPDDVSIIGFDDIPESAHSLPPLTTVHQDFREVGVRAVRHLVARLQGEEPSAEAPIVPTLVRRASTSPV